MSDDERDTEERRREKRADARESEERQTEQHGPVDRSGREDEAEEAVREGVPGAAVNRSD